MPYQISTSQIHLDFNILFEKHYSCVCICVCVCPQHASDYLKVRCTENISPGKWIFWNNHHSLFSSLILTITGDLDLLVNIYVSFLNYHRRLFINFWKVYNLVTLQEFLIPPEQTICPQSQKTHFSKGYILPLSSLVYIVVL